LGKIGEIGKIKIYNNHREKTMNTMKKSMNTLEQSMKTSEN